MTADNGDNPELHLVSRNESPARSGKPNAAPLHLVDRNGDLAYSHSNPFSLCRHRSTALEPHPTDEFRETVRIILIYCSGAFVLGCSLGATFAFTFAWLMR